MHHEMIAGCLAGQLTVVFGYAQAPANPVNKRNAQCFMPAGAGPVFGRRHRFAQIMHQHRKAHQRIWRQFSDAVQRHEYMHPGVDFGMVFFRLRNAEQGVHLWQDFFQCVQFPQHFDKAPGGWREQGALQFLPDAFRGEGSQVASCCHLPGKSLGLFRDGKIQLGGKTRQAQDTQGVITK